MCQATQGRELALTTADGQTVDGYCIGVRVDEVEIRTAHQGMVKIARNARSRVVMQPKRGGKQLASLKKRFTGAVNEEAKWILTPSVAAGLVALPVTVAWAAVAAPFCALGDLLNHDPGPKEIAII